ncbi:MAG: hypothetical protein WAW61_00915 [Methylococcaceae bacterium]
MNIKPPRTFEIFIPNVASIDMDTNGNWPFGRRFEDQVAAIVRVLFLSQNQAVPVNLIEQSLADARLLCSAASSL